MATVAYRLQHLRKLAGTMHTLLDKTICWGAGGGRDCRHCRQCIGCELLMGYGDGKGVAYCRQSIGCDELLGTVAEKVFRTVAGILDVMKCSSVGSIIKYLFVDQGLGRAY
jgi:hypothetical protein